MRAESGDRANNHPPTHCHPCTLLLEFECEFELVGHPKALLSINLLLSPRPLPLLLACLCCHLGAPQVLHPAYLDRFYCSAPPGSPGSSWAQLEARAAATPGFQRFTSPSLHVRAFSATAILFYVSASTP